jgi:putative colanic acid biosynthesis UDP-glucose lipid carrier transferase
MVATQKGRYSKYIRPISILFDLMVITLLSLFFFKSLKLNFSLLHFLSNHCLDCIAIIVKYYEVFRFTTPVEIISKISKTV